MNCYVCGDAAKSVNSLRKFTCIKHGRFIQMQKAAKADKKYIPSLYELESMVPVGMICVDCGQVMNWADSGHRSSGAVLQHYRDGTLGIVCLSCNTKHGFMPDDSYRDLPDGHKLCRTCKTIKPINLFQRRGKGLEAKYPKSRCKVCDVIALRQWREKNPDAYKEVTKRNNDRRKTRHVQPPQL